jgi:hypothetical protein
MTKKAVERLWVNPRCVYSSDLHGWRVRVPLT